MMGNEDVLSLVLRANDEASATLQRVRKEIETTRGSTGGLNQETAAYAVSAGKIQRGALAFGNVARAADDARLGTQGAVRAAATLAETLALTSGSAKFAAMASEIGLVIIAVGTVVGLLTQTKSKLDEIGASPAFKRVLEDADIARVNADIAGLQQRQRELVDQISRNDESTLSRFNRGTSGDLMTGEGRAAVFGEGESAQAQAQQKQLDQVTADLEAALQQRADLNRAAHKTELDDQKSAAQKLRDQIKKDSKTSDDLYFQVSNERVLSEMRTRGETYTAEKQQVEIEGRLREEQINQLKISEDARKDLIVKSRLATNARISEIDEQAANDAGAKWVVWYNHQQDVENERTKSALKRKQEIVGSVVHNAITAQGPLAQQLKRLALEPIAAELEGLAISEGVKVITSWPNAIAMAKHAAGAALAIAGAREVYSLAGSGGGSGSGSSGGGAGGGSSGSGTFEPRDGTQGSGSVTINLITQNPYGRQQIQQVMYELGRAGVLKVPAVNIPATTGIRTS